MRRILVLALITLSGWVACDSTLPGEENMPSYDTRADLQVLSQARILFAHQSVGRDILDGVRELSQEHGIPIGIFEVGASGIDSTKKGIFHLNAGENRKPATKCMAFESVLRLPGAESLQAALLKFCYVDLGEEAGRDGDALFAMFIKSKAQIAEVHPQLKIVDATIPLKSDPLGWKTSLKRLFGRSTWNDEDNIARNAFNEKVVAHAQPGLLLDLAWRESVRPDGKRSGFSFQGKSIYTLHQGYTYDEGHLNDLGKKVMAQEFLKVMAAIVRPQ